MIQTYLTERDVLHTKTVITGLQKKITIEKSIALLEALNVFMLFMLKDLVVAGKIKISIFDIPKLWTNARKLIETILSIFPERNILKQLSNQPYNIGNVLVEYMIWCFQNIVTTDNKVRINIMKIIPFIIRTINLVKELSDMFKRKGYPYG